MQRSVIAQILMIDIASGCQQQRHNIFIPPSKYLIIVSTFENFF